MGPTTCVFASRRHGVAGQLRRVGRDAGTRASRAPRPRSSGPARARLPSLADEAGCSGDSVGNHVRSAAARLRDRLRAALHRGGQPALGVGERNDDLLLRPAGLDDLAVLRELVLAERDARAAPPRRGSTTTPVTDSAAFAYGSRSTSGTPQRHAGAARDRLGVVLRGSGASGGGCNLAACRQRSSTARRSRAKVREEVAAEVAELGHVGLATVLVGDDPASHIYIRLKQKAATEAGIDAHDLRLPADTSPGGAARAARRAQRRRRRRRDPRPAAAARPHRRDAGDRGARARRRTSTASTRSTRARSTSAGRRSSRPRRSGSCRCSPSTRSRSKGARAVVVGRSPSSASRWRTCSSQANATVTICHSRTRDLERTRSTPTCSSPPSGALP